MATSALRAAGYRVGLYTSPHLHRFSERIQVDGRPVSDEELADLIETVRRACRWQDDPANEDRLTYFELATLIGLLCFARHSVCSAEYDGPLSLRGAHQRQDAALARTALERLAPHGLMVSDAAAATGFASTCWPGRLEEIDGVLLDVAHNADGARVLSDALLDLYPDRPVDLVFGVMADKDYREILHILSRDIRRVHLCPALTPRSLAPPECGFAAAELGLLVPTHSTCADALKAARRAAGARGLVCAMGSFSVVAEVRRLLLAHRLVSEGEEPWT